ncbi:DUF6625 family protein [Stutzerimonas xanthomarina]|uniref:DUF6625 family protein n=1 Tax=Stutzerimonas xanthomarina TaxID=271420 RepID=UPI0029A4AEE5|nr:DUF6625 family protein [Stutzerimonas xanthomarina]MDX2353593.1 hypothetical protein [Stutzerimonas xanthomarina]|tara:strand:+ start:7305 stop:8174 length:870 start_codon:yes stop_codon:yes gene_type:complete
MPPRIRFLIPYFGRWPFWMPFFLESCRHNKDIDWLFFSDCGIPPNLPDNVTVEAWAFDDYCRMVSQKIGISFTASTPYKLCDLKPALGDVHADRLKGYDFWGFSDIDLVYGNLRRYFTDERLERYDLLATHSRRISGHLCLFSNTERMRRAYRSAPQWRQRLTSPEHNAFDEAGFSRLFIRRKGWPAPMRWVINQLNPWWRRAEFCEAFSTPDGRIPWVDGSRCYPQRWVWNEGRLMTDKDAEREFPYFHFIGWKCDRWPAYTINHLLPDPKLANSRAWCVTAEGFREV